MLLAVQLYLVLYLKKLSNKLEPDAPGWDAPWIAKDQSRGAQMVVFATFVILPFAAAVFTIGQFTWPTVLKNDKLSGHERAFVRLIVDISTRTEETGSPFAFVRIISGPVTHGNQFLTVGTCYHVLAICSASCSWSLMPILAA